MKLITVLGADVLPGDKLLHPDEETIVAVTSVTMLADQAEPLFAIGAQDPAGRSLSFSCFYYDQFSVQADTFARLAERIAADHPGCTGALLRYLVEAAQKSDDEAGEATGRYRKSDYVIGAARGKRDQAKATLRFLGVTSREVWALDYALSYGNLDGFDQLWADMEKEHRRSQARAMSQRKRK